MRVADKRLLPLLPLLVVSLLAAAAAAAEKSPFQEGRYEKGELKFIQGLPVLVVEGTPQEIGRQKAALTGQAAKAIADYPQKLLRTFRCERRWPTIVADGRSLFKQAPADHREELQTFAKALAIDAESGIVGNTIMDTYRDWLGCSSLLVSAEKSATKAPLFGRNLDFYALGILDQYGLVTVYRPQGKHAFVSVGLPGMFGCLSGMNDAGLALAVHEVFLAADGSTWLNVKGMPYTLCFRRVLEECTTVEEAENLVRGVPRSTMLNLAVCDRRGGAVLEITTKNVVLRRGSDGICACTNHFRSDELAVVKWCRRYSILATAAAMKTIGIDDVAQKLDAVNQGFMTMQTMIFEPVPLVLHLSLGPAPASKRPLQELSLGPLFGTEMARAKPTVPATTGARR
jgi:predicted choloylglycine hydrolase